VDFVSRPGIYQARAVDRVSTVLQRAERSLAPGQSETGTDRPRGSHRAITIERHDGTKLVADLALYELTGDTQYNPYVADGDVIHVPAVGPVVRVSGAVARPGAFELAKQKDVAELFALAGGLSASFTRKLPIRVVRRGREQQAEQVTISAPETMPAIALQDGDSVYVPGAQDLERSVFLHGPVAGASAADEVTSVRRLPYYDGVTVRALIEQTGGLGVSADLQRAYISRKSGVVDPIDLDALLIRRDFSADKPVEVGDTVVVPQRRLGVAVQGAVVTPGVYPHHDRFTVREYLAIAGGPSKQAQGVSNFRIVTPDGKTKKAVPDLRLHNGDTVYVPERAFSRGEIVQLVIGSASLVLGTISVGVLVLR
jgi:protein involved in polysaccharide export with SLBB domain